jgi:SAM-dependent methyltransferase
VKRTLEAEWMDDPALERRLHVEALEGLARLNRVSRAASALWKPLAGLARRHGELSVLDLACGGGDVVRALRERAERTGLPLRIEGCDRSALAIELAGAPGFFVRDVVHDFPSGYDVYLSSLFLHHLPEEDAVVLLRSMAGGRAFFVSDLRRTRMGHALAGFGARIFTRSPVVQRDAPLSVRNAYSMEEAAALVRRAEIENATISKQWPQRFLLSWEK